MQTLSPDACPVIAPPAYAKATSGGLIQFSDFADASAKLCRLGAGYAVARNNLMRERLAFDIPAMGLGLAGAANGAFNGAKDLTLALGIGSAGMAGSTLYFSHATGLIEAGANASVTQSEIKDLMTARDAAVKAQSALAAADQLIVAGPGHLEAFANQVITSATSKIVSGTQNIDAVLALIKAQGGGGSATSNPSPSPVAHAMLKGAGAAAPPVPSAETVIANLNQEAQDANDIVSRINDAWSNFAKCSSS
jgi:hypothetical protein